MYPTGATTPKISAARKSQFRGLAPGQFFRAYGRDFVGLALTDGKVDDDSSQHNQEHNDQRSARLGKDRAPKDGHANLGMAPNQKQNHINLKRKQRRRSKI
jgi:hypothetical protein